MLHSSGSACSSTISIVAGWSTRSCAVSSCCPARVKSRRSAMPRIHGVVIDCSRGMDVGRADPGPGAGGHRSRSDGAGHHGDQPGAGLGGRRTAARRHGAARGGGPGAHGDAGRAPGQGRRTRRGRRGRAEHHRIDPAQSGRACSACCASRTRTITPSCIRSACARCWWRSAARATWTMSTSTRPASAACCTTPARRWCRTQS